MMGDLATSLRNLADALSSKGLTLSLDEDRSQITILLENTNDGLKLCVVGVDYTLYEWLENKDFRLETGLILGDILVHEYWSVDPPRWNYKSEKSMECLPFGDPCVVGRLLKEIKRVGKFGEVSPPTYEATLEVL